MNPKHLSRPVNRPSDSREQTDGSEPPALFGHEPPGGQASPNDSPPATTNGAGTVKPPAPPSENPAPDGEPLDPFDPARLRISQDFAAAAGVKKIITTIPVRKPSREWFVRTHPDPAYRIETAVLELKEDREVYLVDPSLWEELATEATFSPRLLVTSVNRQGVVFLWQIRLPGPDGKIDSWSRSALDAAERARSEWVRVSANMSLGAYDLTIALANFGEPAWPDLQFRDILRIAFRDKTITDWDDAVLRRLRGEV